MRPVWVMGLGRCYVVRRAGWQRNWGDYRRACPDLARRRESEYNSHDVLTYRLASYDGDGCCSARGRHVLLERIWHAVANCKPVLRAESRQALAGGGGTTRGRGAYMLDENQS